MTVVVLKGWAGDRIVHSPCLDKNSSMLPECYDECYGKEGTSLCIVVYTHAEIICKLELLTGGSVVL